MTALEVFEQFKLLSFEDQQQVRNLLDDNVDYSEGFPDPPNSVKSLEQLEQMLLNGLNSGNGTVYNREDWERRMQGIIQNTKVTQ